MTDLVHSESDPLTKGTHNPHARARARTHTHTHTHIFASKSIADLFSHESGEVFSECQCTTRNQVSQHVALTEALLPDACPKFFAILWPERTQCMPHRRFANSVAHASGRTCFRSAR